MNCQNDLQLLSLLPVGDVMIRTQISLDEELYVRAKDTAARHGISLAEFCRRSVAETLAREPDDKPWMKLIGSIDGDIDDSCSVDQIVYGREAP